MKRLISILLLAGIFLQTFSNDIILINFKINKSYIEKYLCENRDKPKMKCHGKCHLKKEIEKNEKKDNSPLNIKENLEIQLYSEVEILYKLIRPSGTFIKEINYSESKSNAHLPGIFHPPTC